MPKKKPDSEGPVAPPQAESVRLPPQGIRKIYVLPDDLVFRIGMFQRAHELRTEAEAVRELIKHGLRATETPVDMAERVSRIVNTGRRAGRIAGMFEDHPLIQEIIISDGGLTLALRGNDDAPVVIADLRGPTPGDRSAALVQEKSKPLPPNARVRIIRATRKNLAWYRTGAWLRGGEPPDPVSSE